MKLIKLISLGIIAPKSIIYSFIGEITSGNSWITVSCFNSNNAYSSIWINNFGVFIKIGGISGDNYELIIAIYYPLLEL